MARRPENILKCSESAPLIHLNQSTGLTLLECKVAKLEISLQFFGFVHWISEVFRVASLKECLLETSWNLYPVPHLRTSKANKRPAKGFSPADRSDESAILSDL